MLFFGLDPIVADSLGTQFTLVLLCGFLFRLSFRSRPGSSRRELPRGPVPVVDARLFATPQHAADDVGDAFGAGPRLPQQFREDRPHLGHRHRRRFFPPAAAAPLAGTTRPATTA